MKKILAILLSLFCQTYIYGQDFDQYFTDATLRIDYIFSGNVDEQHIAVDELCRMPKWYGKRQHLSEIPIEGNGQIIVRDHRSQQVIYRNSFSTLFQEWLSYDEAKSNTQAFQNVFLTPMPKDTVDVTIELYDSHRTIMSALTHMVVPTDILIRHLGEKGVTPYETIQEAEDPSHCIHIAFISEGYQENEMTTFMQDCLTAYRAMFSHEPFKSLRKSFNVVAVKAPSEESGTSSPSLGIWKKTALHSHFDTFYSDRYLTTLNLKDLHDWLAGTPYEHIIILVNSDQYGGGGILNSYNLTSTHHSNFKPVVVHEFGHSFGGLGDEYAYETEQIPMYPPGVEPWEPNLTTLTDFHGKWEDLIEEGTPIPTPESTSKKTIRHRVGLFEGAGYALKGVYRACQDCRMRTNENPIFCPVCDRHLRKLIDFYTK